MQKQDKAAYLAAISLFMSALEMFIPHPLPFFRIGLANIPILLAFSMDTGSFLLLSLLKGIGTSYVSGNLFSVFGIMSIVQSLLSASASYAIYHVAGCCISIYGISLAGALISAIAQIAVASLYAGRGMLIFLPPLIIMSFPAALITAFLSKHIRIPDEINLEYDDESRDNRRAIISMLISVSAVMMIRTPIPALIAFLSALLFQKASGRKIKILPHLLMLIFMVLSSLLTPEGRILFSLFSFPVTEDALLRGIASSLRLSASIALSQGFYSYIKPSGGIIGKTLAAFTTLLEEWKHTSGKLTERINETLMMNNAIKYRKTAINIPLFTSILLPSFLIFILVCDYLFF